MMTADELLKCVTRLAPNAICSVCQESPDSGPYIKWDIANTKPMPTTTECEAILPMVRAEIQSEIGAEQARVAAKAKAISDNLPSLSQILTKIDTLDSIPKIREFLKKLATVVYMDITGKID